MTHLHILVPAITRGTLARTHELKTNATASFLFFFLVGKKKLFVAERCHMAEGCQTNPECFAVPLSRFQYAEAWWEDLKLREDM